VSVRYASKELKLSGLQQKIGLSAMHLQMCPKEMLPKTYMNGMNQRMQGLKNIAVNISL
jgi:hypothetical protein